MTDCVSKPVAEPEVVLKVVYVCPDLYFPKFPAPADGIIIPLTADYKRVTSEYDEDGNPVEVVYDIVPEWWLKLILNFKLDVDSTKAKYESYRSSIPSK